MDRPRVERFGAVVVRISADPATDAARSLAVRLRGALRRRGRATLAVSGGSAAPAMLETLAGVHLDWGRVTIWQVDERVVADDDPDRNLHALRVLPAEVREMPVTDADLLGAAARYAAGLPPRFDAVHLGLGSDGHSASWPPAPHPDARVVDSAAAVATVGRFNGHVRMTLTPHPVNRARSRLLLAGGAGKATIVRRWLASDPALPAAAVWRSATTLFLDEAAAAGIETGYDRSAVHR